MGDEDDVDIGPFTPHGQQLSLVEVNVLRGEARIHQNQILAAVKDVTLKLQTISGGLPDGPEAFENLNHSRPHQEVDSNMT
jgi:hypothetical protein